MKIVNSVLIAALITGPALAHDHLSVAGQPGDATSVDRVIDISAEDIKFIPTAITVHIGETVKFVVTNHGKLTHEFVIADKAGQEMHEKEMQSMGTMEHHDSNALSIQPGESKALIWKFTQAGTIQYGCHVPGHYVAGMIGDIQVVK